MPNDMKGEAGLNMNYQLLIKRKKKLKYVSCITTINYPQKQVKLMSNCMTQSFANLQNTFTSI